MSAGGKPPMNNMNYPQSEMARAQASESLGKKSKASRDESAIEGEIIDDSSQSARLEEQQGVSPLGAPTSGVEENSLEAIIEARDRQISQLRLELAESERQQRELQLRHLAEKQNLQRRAEQDIEKAHKFSLEKIARALLPVLDSFERAVALADRENVAALPMIEGLELTFKSLDDTLFKFGIEAVGKPGIPFDPDRHQAMSLVETELHQPNHVVTVMQKGYMLNGRLLRAAMVTVSRSADG